MPARRVVPGSAYCHATALVPAVGRDHRTTPSHGSSESRSRYRAIRRHRALLLKGAYGPGQGTGETRLVQDRLQAAWTITAPARPHTYEATRTSTQAAPATASCTAAITWARLTVAFSEVDVDRSTSCRGHGCVVDQRVGTYSTAWPPMPEAYWALGPGSDTPDAQVLDGIIGKPAMLGRQRQFSLWKPSALHVRTRRVCVPVFCRASADRVGAASRALTAQAVWRPLPEFTSIAGPGPTTARNAPSVTL